MTYDVGTELLITMSSGSTFEATVITPEWALFELARAQHEMPLALPFIRRIDLTISRVGYGAYDEIMCYWVGVAAQAGVGFVYRIGKYWLMDTIGGNAVRWHEDNSSWNNGRVTVRRKE